MLSLTFSRLLGISNKQQGIVAPYSASGVTQTSSGGNQIHPNIGSTGQSIEQSTGVLPPNLSGSPSSSALHAEVVPAEHPSFIESALISPGRISHPLRYLSSSPTTAHSNISSRIMLVSDAHITTSSSALGTQGNRRDVPHSTPMRISRRENEPAPSTPDIDEPIPALGEHQDD